MNVFRFVYSDLVLSTQFSIDGGVMKTDEFTRTDVSPREIRERTVIIQVKSHTNLRSVIILKIVISRAYLEIKDQETSVWHLLYNEVKYIRKRNDTNDV